MDTHVLLWWLQDSSRLPSAMRTAITEAEVSVSAASVWEMSIKAALGKLDMPDDLLEEMQRQGFTELAITASDGLAAGALPRHHDDPFDRLLVAQARRRDLLLVTADRRLAAYDVRVLTS